MLGVLMHVSASKSDFAIGLGLNAVGTLLTVFGPSAVDAAVADDGPVVASDAATSGILIGLAGLATALTPSLMKLVSGIWEERKAIREEHRAERESKERIAQADRESRERVASEDRKAAMERHELANKLQIEQIKIADLQEDKEALLKRLTEAESEIVKSRAIVQDLAMRNSGTRVPSVAPAMARRVEDSQIAMPVLPPEPKIQTFDDRTADGPPSEPKGAN